MNAQKKQLRGYIPLSVPLNWEPVTGKEPPLRIGASFTMNWFHKRVGVDFSEPFHVDPVFRFESIMKMKNHVRESFPDIAYFREHDLDGLERECATVSGVFGVCLMAMVYGLKPVYFNNNWPAIHPDNHLSVEQIKKLKPFDLKNNPAVEQLFEQMDTIQKKWGVIDGYVNYQGILNNAFKLRGDEIFIDMVDDPGFVHHLFGHITETMIELIHMVQKRQRESGFYADSMSTSNCLVNMISPEMYSEFILSCDIRLSQVFEAFGVHTCNWIVDPYIDAFKKIENLGYIDFGFNSDLERIGRVFKNVRKHVFYNPSDLENKTEQEIKDDVLKICKHLGPCDLSVPDIEYFVPDEKIIRFFELAESVAKTYFSNWRD